MIRAGVLSDTHITIINQQLRESIHSAFSTCDVILHAGDITNLAVLDLFRPKTVYAVRGNMCDLAVHKSLPEQRIIQLENWAIGL